MMTPSENRSPRGESDSHDASDRVPLWMRLFPILSIGTFLAFLSLILWLIPTPQASGPRIALGSRDSDTVVSADSEAQLAQLEVEPNEAEIAAGGPAAAEPDGGEESLAAVLARAAAVEKAALDNADTLQAAAKVRGSGDELDVNRDEVIRRQKRADERPISPGMAKAVEVAKARHEFSKAAAASAGRRKAGAQKSNRGRTPVARAQTPPQAEDGAKAPPEPKQKVSEASAAARTQQCDLSRWSSMGNMVTGIEGNEVKVNATSWNALPTAAREQLARWMLRCVEGGGGVSIVASDTGSQIASYDAESGFKSVQ